MTKNVSTDKATDSAVAIPQVKLSDAELRNLGEAGDAFTNAMALVTDRLGAAPADASTELGTGFALVTNKDQLIGRAMLLVSWSFNVGDFGNAAGEKGQFVSITIVTQDGGKYIVNDGGSGIYAQLEAYTERTGLTGGMLVRKGFRKSEYSNDVTDHGVTHYLDTSA
jgi:hypothetical protein